MKLALFTVALVALMASSQIMAQPSTERSTQKTTTTTTEKIENCVGPACPAAEDDGECKCSGICEHVVSVDPCVCGRNWSCPELTKGAISSNSTGAKN